MIDDPRYNIQMTNNVISEKITAIEIRIKLSGSSPIGSDAVGLIPRATASVSLQRF